MGNGDDTRAAGGLNAGLDGMFQPGEVLAGHFEIVRMLGFGGMGVVYEAINRFSGERIALKCIKSVHGQNRQSNARFVHEINMARKLRHPNIVAVYDVAQEGEQLFFTMEYLDGVSLRGRLNQLGLLPLGEVVHVMRQLCNALEYAHRFMVHRDLSPDNVFLMRDGGVKLLDFGLARDVSRETMTMSGARLGKAQYMSPEQRKDASHVDARADVYALGVMFFELLSGQLPLGYARLSDHVPGLPPACDELAGRALAPLERRIQSAAEFRAALEACLAPEASHAASVSPQILESEPLISAPEVAARQTTAPRGFPWPGRAIALAAAGLAVVLVVGAVWNRQQPSPAAQPEQVVQQSPPGGAGSPKKTGGTSEEPILNPLLPANLGSMYSPETAILLGDMYKKLVYAPPPSGLKVTWEVKEREAFLRLPGDLTLPMVWIPAGSFEAGSPIQLGDDFLPVHSVTLTRGFWLAKYEVTQAQWTAVMSANPSPLVADQLPVEGVSWDDAMLFIKRLNRAGGRHLRLPTEAEWVYACQAGIKAPGQIIPDGASVDDYAWHSKNSNGRAHAVGKKLPNAWGIFDMTGNVDEWCSDYYLPNYRPKTPQTDPQGPAHGSERIVMGGSYRGRCDVAGGNRFPPGIRAATFGMRLCADQGEI